MKTWCTKDTSLKKVYMKLELSETLELETAFISQKHN